MRVNLTDRFCSTATAKGAQSDFFDERTPGLALRVGDGGRRSWCFLFTSPRDGKRARLSFGSYPAVSLAAARGRALEARSMVESGTDPRDVGQAAGGMTFAALVERYLADPRKKALRSYGEIARRLRRNVVPIIGAVKISEMRRRDVRNVTDALMARGVEVEAIRVFEDCRAITRWAVEHEYLDADPIAGLKRPADSVPRERVLSPDEIRTVWNVLPVALPRTVQVRRIIKLCLVTAQRVGEVSGMTRDELDLKAREWKLPGSRTKNGRPHVVPLSDSAIAIIEEALADSDGPHVFPCRSGAGPLLPVVIAHAILFANKAGRFGIAQWVCHDLRRTALTQMAEIGVQPIVLGFIANHRGTTRATVTMAVYARYDYGREKRQALDLWADRLAAIVAGDDVAKVLPMERRK